MARATVVSTWFLDSWDAWAVELDGLEGTVKSGQHVTLTLEGEVAGPHRIRSVEFSDHLATRRSYVALIVRAARKRGLDRFIGGSVETTDPL